MGIFGGLQVADLLFDTDKCWYVCAVKEVAELNPPLLSLETGRVAYREALVAC